jgi:hyperosmotically inducible protein
MMKRTIKNLSFIACLIFTVALISCAGSRTRESTGEYVDSSVISAKVKTALLADPDVSGLAIEVETFKDVVQLSGFVDTKEQAEKAAEIARNVEGVKSVKNSLIVK